MKFCSQLNLTIKNNNPRQTRHFLGTFLLPTLHCYHHHQKFTELWISAIIYQIMKLLTVPHRERPTQSTDSNTWWISWVCALCFCGACRVESARSQSLSWHLQQSNQSKDKHENAVQNHPGTTPFMDRCKVSSCIDAERSHLDQVVFMTSNPKLSPCGNICQMTKVIRPKSQPGAAIIWTSHILTCCMPSWYFATLQTQCESMSDSVMQFSAQMGRCRFSVQWVVLSMGGGVVPASATEEDSAEHRLVSAGISTRH